MKNIEIKFRIWDKKYQNWENPEEFGLNHKGELVQVHNNKSSYLGQYVIQQFIGKIDDEENPIFVGDILRKTFDGSGMSRKGKDFLCIPGNKIISFTEYLEVKVLKNCLGFYYDEKNYVTYGENIKYVVCGNIFENPELLEKI